MKILAIESATAASSVALGEGQSLAAISTLVDARGHVEFIVPAIDFNFARLGWCPDDLDIVAVDVGPGTFSGIRAGVAAAQAISAAIGVPIVTVSSLMLLAMRAATDHHRIWPLVDVRRGQIATSPYRSASGGLVRDGSAELLTPDEFKKAVEADPMDALIVGDIDALPRDFFCELDWVKWSYPRYPSADVILEYAALAAVQEDFVGSQEIHPFYMREPDARINWADFREEGMWPAGLS